MWWGYGPGGGWGFPFGMLLMPVMVVLVMFSAMYFFRRFPGGMCRGFESGAERELIDEVRRLRVEVEELRKIVEKERR